MMMNSNTTNVKMLE